MTKKIALFDLKQNKKICCTNIERLLSNLSILSLARRKRQFYRFVFKDYLIIIIRRRSCIHKIIEFDEDRNLNKLYDSYNRFRVKQMMNTNDVDENSSFMRNYMNVACDKFRTKQTSYNKQQNIKTKRR